MSGLMNRFVGSLEMALAWVKGPTFSDLTFAEVEGKELCLDLYLPFWKKNCRALCFVMALVIYFHGGGWQMGTYKNPAVNWLVGYGFAVASVQHRLSGEAKFPAQVHDAKGAIRWLRAHAEEYGYEASRVAVVGVSSGGHVAMMAGLGEGDLEGEVGGHLEESSVVSAMVNYFGASDLVLRSQTQPGATEPVGSVVRNLLGVAVSEDEDLAKKASPAFQVREEAPPLLVIHGAQDPQVKVDQAYRMAEAYKEAGQEVALEVLPEGGHGGAEFFNRGFRQRVGVFLQEKLMG